MARMTIRLPETLHAVLQQQASKEGLSLNQFILYSLTRQSAFAHAIETLPPKQVMEQQARFHTLLQSLGPGMNDAEWEAFIAQRNGARKLNVSRTTERKLRAKIAKRQKTKLS